jgi:hypothetical protein
VKFFHEAVKGARLLNGIQILALDIFDKREFQRLLVGNFPQNDGHAQELRTLRGAPSPLSGDELISRSDLSRDQRLYDSAHADGLREFLERRFREVCAGLIRARVDQINVHMQRSADDDMRRGDGGCGSCGCEWLDGLRNRFRFTN